MSTHEDRHVLRAIGALTRRELVRVGRQPARIVAGVGTVALIWLIFASGLAGSMSGGTFGAFLAPGMASMVVLFASIFGAISLIEDREQGFLRGVLVSPVPRWAVMASKVIGGGAIALAQGALVLALAPLSGISPGVSGWVLALLALACMGAGVTGLALALAWRCASVAGFHGVMNLVLMPMWLLGGTIFPLDTASPWLAWIMRVNPLTWTGEALRRALTGESVLGVWAWVGAAGFALAGFALATIAASAVATGGGTHAKAREGSRGGSGRHGAGHVR